MAAHPRRAGGPDDPTTNLEKARLMRALVRLLAKRAETVDVDALAPRCRGPGVAADFAAGRTAASLWAGRRGRLE